MTSGAADATVGPRRPSRNGIQRSALTVTPVSARKSRVSARDTATVGEPAAGRPCAHCGVVKPLDAFAPNRRMRDGRSSWCHECANTATRAWRATCRDELNAARRVHHPARACRGCELEFVPRRVDAWHCCKSCADYGRANGQPLPDWQARHRAHHLTGAEEAPPDLVGILSDRDWLAAHRQKAPAGRRLRAGSHRPTHDGRA